MVEERGKEQEEVFLVHSKSLLLSVFNNKKIVNISKQNLTLNVSCVIVIIGQVTVQRGTPSTPW